MLALILAELRQSCLIRRAERAAAVRAHANLHGRPGIGALDRSGQRFPFRDHGSELMAKQGGQLPFGGTLFDQSLRDVNIRGPLVKEGRLRRTNRVEEWLRGDLGVSGEDTA